MEATDWLASPVRSTSISTLAGSNPRASNRILESLSNRQAAPAVASRVLEEFVTFCSLTLNPISLRTSAAVSTSLAPLLISAWQPRESGLWIEPGIANPPPPRLPRQSRRNQRAAVAAGLDHQRAQ